MTKTSSMCWFPWYPKDWLTSDAVGKMKDDQIVAYVFLLNRQWVCKGCILTDDIEVLSKYAMHDLMHDGMQCVLDLFPVRDGGRANERLYQIYLEQSAKHQKRVDSANKRWSKDTKDNAMDDAMHVHSASDSDSISVSSSKLLKESFERCWKLYPSKAGSKHKAFEAYKKANPQEQDVVDGIVRYEAFVASERSRGFKDLKYANGQTWFNGRSWESEYEIEEEKPWVDPNPESIV